MRFPPRIIPLAIGCALAGVLGACDPQPTGSSAGPPSPPTIVSSAATTCAPPECDRIVATVELAWTPTSSPIVGYRVVRDGEEIASLPAIGPASTSLVDRSAVIGATHSYEVVAVAENGARAAAPPTEVIVPLPPLEVAQVEGAFVVTLSVIHAVNLRELAGIADPHPGLQSDATWTLVAACPPAVGACDLRWNGHPGVLSPSDRVYRGVSSAGSAHCPDGARVSAPIRLRLRVVSADVVGGAWVASRIRGRLASSFRCPGFARSSGVARFTGALR
ncbi:MAG: hypothetical protein ABI572_07650 [Actinomycetota bacterium]